MSTTPPLLHEPPSLPSSPLPKRPKTEMPSSTTAPAPGNNSAPPLPTAASPPLLVKKLSPQAKTPTRGSAFAAGYDIYSAKECVIPKRGKGLVDTDISIAVGDGCCRLPAACSKVHVYLLTTINADGRIAPRSGLAVKHFIDTGAGVIDSDYRGQVKVLLFNHSEVDFEIKEGDRIAQLVIERIYTPEVVVVENLEETVRGEGGFGSSG